MKRLTLGKLRSATCGFETVFFTLFHSRVAGQEACGLQGSAVALIDEEQCACDTVTDSAGLAGNAAAVDGSLDVNLADGAGGDQGLTNDELQSLSRPLMVIAPVPLGMRWTRATDCFLRPVPYIYGLLHL